MPQTLRLTLHESTTYFTPRIVIDVSAMFVARIIFLDPSGVLPNIPTCELNISIENILYL